MKDIWTRIDMWLAANAPEGYGHLRPGASAEAVRAAEEAIGRKLPTDAQESFRIHDGQDNEPGLIGGEGWCLLTLEEMVKFWRTLSNNSQGPRDCVPLAWGGAGDYILLDLRPGVEKPGRLIVRRSDTDGSDPVAPSFRAWLEDFADKLEEDEFAYSESDGCLMDADEIDLD